MISAADIANMKECAEASMLDIGVPGSKGAGSGKNPTSGDWAYDDDNPVSCGVNANMSDEVFDGSQQTITDAVIRIPVGTAVSSKNRWKVTHRLGTELSTPEIYAILGAPKLNVAELKLSCRRVTNGSVR